MRKFVKRIVVYLLLIIVILFISSIESLIDSPVLLFNSIAVITGLGLLCNVYIKLEDIL